MAQYKLYCNGASGNSYKIALYLNCACLDWEPIGVDFASGVTRDANWRANMNLMGEVPVLEPEAAGGRRSTCPRRAAGCHPDVGDHLWRVIAQDRSMIRP